MTDTTSATPMTGGFTGDPADAFTVTGTGGCCGNPAQAPLALPDPAAATAAPCCGTTAEAEQSGSCCGIAAKRQAVDAGQGCCG
ncbi:hypothetical protein FHR83_008474 [Actinoplanes campanulatus]|uniref:Uncharacterized protein n=1 Tax=Actinoplanes campanulatus TaxID=113559 RepID=A0A7W5FJG8_9ACTN|nr:hypothetical protein [Actinoplanes campanulatus]MBB3100749.1 hypothetical protein [Actinoplanes campanulatus]GGN46136.1 hypothetical protein GCM10010109_81030 [Actinoplanes campanulatus]GID41189.1 hypothetical protein Aca09nite_76950 [Actinoplanes campanulatus]